MIQLKPRYWALIAAGGIGQRMGSGVPKQYRMLGGMTVLERCVRQLARVQALSGFVVGALEHPVIEVLATDSKNFLEGRTFIRSDAGEIRAETVLNGISRIEQYAAPDDWVLIHDAARPLVAPGDVERLINAVGDHAVGGLLGWPVTDSIALVKDNMMVQSVDREGLWRAATPQMFRIQDLRAALELALARGDTITDEASVLSACGKHPLWVACSPTNFKLTTPEDFAMAEKIISAKPTTRVGTGFDVHAFSEGRKLVLGGVEIPHDRGLAGHSDADVLLHAICDACLGAAALGDLGHHFPDTDARYKGIDSRQLLRHVNTLLGNKGFRLVNIDASVIAQAPRLAPFVASMTANIAADCRLASDAVSVKATTTEGLGFAGREEGIAAQAVVTVVTGNDLL